MGFDRSRIALDGKVYVDFLGGIPVSVSLTRTSDSSVPHWISWIAPSEWYVPLVDRKAPSQYVERVEKILVGRLKRSVVAAALEHAMTEVRPREMTNLPLKYSGPLGQVLAVTGRLELCDAFYKSTDFKWSGHWFPLVVYLHLTCFDVLGQRKGWVQFNEWLMSKKTHHQQERAGALLGISPDPINAAKKFADVHSEIYGVRNSFFRFVSDGIPSTTRAQLLGSIRASTLSNPPLMGNVDPRGGRVEDEIPL